MDVRLIGITGFKGAGKSSVAACLERHGYVEYALAEPIKEGLQVMFDLPEEAFTDRGMKEAPVADIGASPRFLAQTLGTEWGRRLVADDLWLRVMKRKMRRTMQHCTGVVVSDVRFDNEARWIRDAGGAVVRVSGPKLDAHMRWLQRNTWFRRSLFRLGLPVDPGVHPSEFGVSQHLVSAEIRNDGTLDDLRDRTDAALARLRCPPDAEHVPIVGKM